MVRRFEYSPNLTNSLQMLLIARCRRVEASCAVALFATPPKTMFWFSTVTMFSGSVAAAMLLTTPPVGSTVRLSFSAGIGTETSVTVSDGSSCRTGVGTTLGLLRSPIPLLAIIQENTLKTVCCRGG